MNRIILLLILVGISPVARAAEPAPGPSFVVELKATNMTEGFIAEVANLGSENEVIEHKVLGPGGESIIQKIPGRLKWLDVTFKRGLSKSKSFEQWRKLVVDGNIADARRTVEITVYDASLIAVAKWKLERAWPSALVLVQTADGTFVESLRLVHEGMTRVDP